MGSFFVHTKGSLEAWEDSHSAKRGALFPVVKHVNSSDQHYQRTSVSTDATFKHNKWWKVPKEIFSQCTFVFPSIFNRKVSLLTCPAKIFKKSLFILRNWWGKAYVTGGRGVDSFLNSEGLAGSLRGIIWPPCLNSINRYAKFRGIWLPDKCLVWLRSSLNTL